MPSGDCTVVLGDLNVQLAGNHKPLTDKWDLGEASENADIILDMMRMYNLSAVHTFFKPKRNTSNATFLKSRTNTMTSKVEATDQYADKPLCVRFKGRWISGKVMGYSGLSEGGVRLWSVYLLRMHRDVH